jgi:spore coat protein U-like protein
MFTFHRIIHVAGWQWTPLNQYLHGPKAAATRMYRNFLLRAINMTTFRTWLTALSAGLTGLILTLSATAIHAATDTGTLNITATVLDSCEISATSVVAFGNLTPFSTAPDVDADGTITWACTTGSAGTVGIADTDRNLTSLTTATSIAYELYSDSGRSSVWTAPAGGGDVAVISAGMSTTADLTVYGRIPGASYLNADVGAYTDDLVVTITFNTHLRISELLAAELIDA